LPAERLNEKNQIQEKQSTRKRRIQWVKYEAKTITFI